MICDKCGKSNASGVSVCSYCGMEMPKSTEYNGFADILTVKAAEPVTLPTSEEKGKVSDADMKNLLNKTNEIFKNTKFSLAAICICILISAISIFMAFSTNAKLNEYEKKLDTIIENTSANEDKVTSDASGIESVDGKNVPNVFGEEEYTPETKNKFNEIKKNVETKIEKNQPQKPKNETTQNSVKAEPKGEAPQTEVPQTEASQTETSQAEAPQVEDTQG